MPQSLNGKGINEMNELDCLRALLARNPGATNALLYIVQSLTAPQQTQARANIGLPVPITPDKGGTGVANNAASTITISGNFGTTFIVTGATSVTLPASGTLLSAVAGVLDLTFVALTLGSNVDASQMPTTPGGIGTLYNDNGTVRVAT